MKLSTKDRLRAMSLSELKSLMSLIHDGIYDGNTTNNLNINATALMDEWYERIKLIDDIENIIKIKINHILN
jgi:hypothetical protein